MLTYSTRKFRFRPILCRFYSNILVVVKQTPYEQYLQSKAQGKAPVALRWDRLKNRYEVHRQCVESVLEVLRKSGKSFSVIGREEMHRGLVLDKDLVIAVGGDGTILNSASFLDESTPILGINSDPTRPEERGVTNLKDGRRSRGALCAATANEIDISLPRIIAGERKVCFRTRVQCVVRSTYTETRLPPALNDILMSHPCPAAVSRFRLALSIGKVLPSFELNRNFQEVFSFNAWSSGLWICTATGSTAAMRFVIY